MKELKQKITKIRKQQQQSNSKNEIRTITQKINNEAN